MVSILKLKSMRELQASKQDNVHVMYFNRFSALPHFVRFSLNSFLPSGFTRSIKNGVASTLFDAGRPSSEYRSGETNTPSQGLGGLGYIKDLSCEVA